MRTIDGTKFMSASEYATLKNISKGRVSQIKSTLPFERFDDFGVELINVDLLELQEDERRLLELQHSTKQAIHQYNYQQLGQFFSKLLGELTKAEEAAKAEASLMEEKWNASKSDLINMTKTKEELTGKVQGIEQQVEQLQQINTENTQTLERVQSENKQLREVAADWQGRYEKLSEQKEELLQKVMQLQEERAKNLTLLADLKGRKDAESDLQTQIEDLKKAVSRLINKKKDGRN